jgi:hypothetical protein
MVLAFIQYYGAYVPGKGTHISYMNPLDSVFAHSAPNPIKGHNAPELDHIPARPRALRITLPAPSGGADTVTYVMR